MATYTHDLPAWIDLLRTQLGDTTLPVLWDDNTLTLVIQQAIATHSSMFPWFVRLYWLLSNGDQDVALIPLDTGAAYDTAAVAAPTVPTVGADLLAVVRVDLAGLVLPPVPQPSAILPGSRVSRSPQGYSAWPNVLHLRAPITGLTGGGTTVLTALIAQSWIYPATGVDWNGPLIDVPLILLLAERTAYRLLADWQARTQGLTTPAIAGSSTNVHLDIPPLLASVEVELARELALREPRRVVLPPFPVGL